jgi:hypothetical protein
MPGIMSEGSRKDEKIAMDNQSTEQQPSLTVGLVIPLRNSSIF